MILKAQWLKFLDNVKLGMSIIDSAEMAGISREVVYKRSARDNKFKQELNKAKLEPKRRAIGLIQKAALNTWQSAAWFLERVYPEEFSIRQRFEHTGANGQPIQSQVTTDLKIDLSKFSLESLEKLSKELSTNQPTIKKDEPSTIIPTKKS